MKYLCSAVLARSHRVLALLTLVMFSSKGQAGDFTTSVSQPDSTPAQTWNDAIWEPGLVSPSAGNTYEVLIGGRIWSPPLAGVQTFPGDSLILDANASIRARGPLGAIYGTTLNFPGVEGNAGLVLNGGKLQADDDCAFTIAGRMAVVTNSIIDHGYFAGNFVIAAQIEGAGNLALVSGSSERPLDIRSSDNAFSGTWFVKKGYLKGTANGSLGTGNILIASGARFAVDYDIQTLGSLTLLGSNSVMDLHQDCQFGAVSIDDTPLAPGTYTYAELAAQFPGNFAADGSGSMTVTSFTDEIAPNNDEMADPSMMTSEEETMDAMNLSLSPDVQTAAPSQFAPTVPSGVMVFANSESQITIQWNASIDTSGLGLIRYRVSRNGAALGMTFATSYTDSGLTPFTQYCYTIQAYYFGYGASGMSSPSAQACAWLQGAPMTINSPGNLTATAVATNRIDLTWTDNSDNEDGFGIERYQPATGIWALIATVGADTMSYSDVGLTPSTTYTYRIYAYGGSTF